MAILFAGLQTFAQTYTYDNLNRLTKVVYENGTTITYTYDALGNRMTKKVTGASLDTYTITTYATPSGSGVVTGGGDYSLGTTIELNAIPNAGYEFLKWSDGVTDNPRTLNVTNNMSYTAQFKESTVISGLLGDIVADGKVNQLDLNALVDAYITNTQVTQVTDLDTDGSLTIADITKLVSIINPDSHNGLTKEVEGAIYTLRKELMDRNDVHINPDGSQFYRTRLMLDVTKGSSKKTYEIGDYVYILDEEDFHTCMEFDLNSRKIIVFANSKTSANNYGMDGFAFVSSLDQLSFSKESVFTSSNWGWYPYFEETDNHNYSMIYFSYAGYYKMRAIRNSDGTWNNERVGSIRPEVAAEEWENIDRMLVVGGMQINSNGHEYIDLGLPSGTLWATCNVGATTPEEIGGLYAWGETETKDVYSWATYKWCDGDVVNKTNQNLTKYCDRGGYGKLDGKLSLELEDDVAHVKWGGDWHMPTREEFQELIDNCTFEWLWLDEEKTIRAYKITGTNGNSIIMPAGFKKNDTYNNLGFYYWSTNLRVDDIPSNNHATHVTCLDYLSKTETELIDHYRYCGYPVRPVLSKYTPLTHTIFGAPTNYLNHELVDLGLPSGELWATCNIGASSPERSGCYYAWGEITSSCEGKTTFNSSTYTTDMTNYTEVGVILNPSDDTATMNWGGEWRMPTSREINELINTNYTTCEWTTLNGVNGYRVTSIVKGFEGNNIFLPAAGTYKNSEIKYIGEYLYYWSSTLYSDPDGSYNAGQLRGSSTSITYGGNLRYYGLSIRPVVSFDAIVK